MAKKRRNNEGSIHKRKYGSWRAQITIDGKRLSFTSNSYKDCQEWLRAILHKIDTGLTYDKSQITFEEFLNNWLASAKASLRSKTWRQYQQISRDYILPKLGELKLIDLRPDLIQAVYDRNIDTGVGLRTIQLTHAVIRRALNRAVSLGLLDKNPAAVTIPPKPKP